MTPEEAVAKMLSYSDNPSKIITGLYAYQLEHKNHLLKHIGKGIKHFEHGFDVLILILDRLNYVPKGSRPVCRSAQWLMIKNNIPTLFSCFQERCNGSYDSTFLITRSLFESIIKIIHISWYPNDIECVFFRREEPGKRQFHMRNFLEQDMKLPDWYHITYHSLSITSHSNGFEVLKERTKLNTHGQKEPIQNIWQRDVEKVNRIYNYMSFILWAYLHIVKELFVVAEDIPNSPELYDSFYTTEEALSMLISRSPNRFGEQMHGDLLKAVAIAKSKPST